MTPHIGRAAPVIIRYIRFQRHAVLRLMVFNDFHTHHQPLYKNRPKTESRLIIHQFEIDADRKKETFLKIIETYKSNVRPTQNTTDFIRVALKYMEEFGVNKDLETYKKVLDVLPKGKYIPRNMYQVLFMHYPVQQQLIVDLLHQMEENGVMPDRQMEIMLLNIFGCQGLPLKKYWRMMYWMPKFKNVNPWLVTNEILANPMALARMALKKMTHIDPQTKIQEIQTKDVQDTTEDTWVLSAMSPQQKDLLAVLPLTNSLYVEGPHTVWVAYQQVNYFVLRGDPIKRDVIYIDEDDISDIKIPYHELRKVGVAPTVHEQDDGAYYAMCTTGTSSKDSVVSWIRYLQQENPILNQVPVVFKLKSSTAEKTLVDQVERGVQNMEGSGKNSQTAETE